MVYTVRRKTGRLRSGNESDRGAIFHAVIDIQFAMCGTEPGRLSDWSTYQGAAVTCPRCLSKLNATKS